VLLAYFRSRRHIRSRNGRQIEWSSDHMREWMFIRLDKLQERDRLAWRRMNTTLYNKKDAAPSNP
jgi:hypothetical protein